MAHAFTFLEHIALADAAFDASGDSPAELFAAAAEAVIDTMVDPTTVSAAESYEWSGRGPDLGTLLFDWLSHMVFLKDARTVMFRDVRTTVTRDETGSGWVFHGTLHGEPINPSRHQLRADVKAVTKHLYQVRQDGGRWTARVVLDI
jgi:SHS2 domain-containing protein